MRQIIAALAFVAACSGSSKTSSTTQPPPTGSGTDPGATTGNCTDPKPTPDSVCQQDCGEPVAQATDPPRQWRWVSKEDAERRAIGGCPICLPPDAQIATPSGDIAVGSLVAGAIVWSMDDQGRRIAVPVVRVGSTATPREHVLMVLELADGREVSGSPGHPTADARQLGTLVVGDSLDGAKVVGIRRRPYGERRTFDLLPASATRAYWADGVLLSSTLR